MAKILRLLFEFEAEYVGPPCYIPGNALRHALSIQVNTSVGMFTQASTLIQPRTYHEFFIIRTDKCFLHPYFEKWFDKVKHKRSFRCFFLPQYVTFDLLESSENLIEEIREKKLIQFGGMRNCGFGVVILRDFIEIDIDNFEFPDKASHLTFLSPTIYFPPFTEHYDCRHKTVKVWNHNKVNKIRVVAPGQFFRIKPGKDVARIARKGILRKVPLGQLGFGEFLIHDWTRS